MSRKPKSGSAVRGSLITSASWVSAVDDATRDYQLRRRLGQGGEPPRSDCPTDKIQVRLASGGPYPIGTPLEVGAAIFSPVSREKNWHAADLRSGNGTIGITLEPASTSKFTWLQIGGVSVANVDVNDIAHERADCPIGGTSLSTGAAGPFRLVTRPTMTGSQRLAVRYDVGDTETPFLVRNEYSNLVAGRGLELGQLHASGAVRADVRSNCTRAYAILAEDINVNMIGKAKVSGWATARVNVLKTEHTHCYLPVSETIFKTGFGGPLELAQTPTTTGAQNLLVRWQPLYRRRVFTNVTISADNVGDCTFYSGPGLGSLLGTDDVYFNWMKGGVTSIASGVEGWATWDDGICAWILDSAECD